ncbi:lysoplasmalogenase [Salarias fasciatus]|uniref:lysoplasmalogenase n=1 Tax=Salarias fasciatus TaxID=181472 RepID=UPI0011769946|nr:lysoplasmalogenase-like [Salarias fasciatus]
MDILDTHAYDRRQRRNMSCALLFSLLPFFLSSGLYFYLWTADAPSSITASAVKSAPAVLLAAAVLSWNGAQSVLGVAGGLLLSAVGDWCLTSTEHFLHGMGAFAAAHVLYSLSFLSSRYATHSSSSWTRLLYPVAFLAGGAFYIFLFPFLKKAPNADLLTPAVAIYIFLIAVMCAIAISTRYTATLLGALTFAVSDVILALHVFKVMPETDHSNSAIMATYYLAQLLIAVGDVKATENKDDFGKWKRS